LKRRNLRHNCSGQVLVITSLLVALILLSTGMYVIETEKDVPTIGVGMDNVSPAYQQSIRSTLISALSNITSGGNSSILSTDLDELNSVLTSHSYQNLIKIDYTPLNVTPYQSGILVSRGTSGQGISSAYVNYVFNSSGLSTYSSLESAASVTSAINLTGKCLQLDNSLTQVNLTINLLSDGKPALAQNFTLSFQNSTNWVPVREPNINNFGNGTYAVSFNAETDQISVPLTVSVECKDQRGITVGASVRCSS
jgi:hypothetical protein